jgi:CII-binding regulator of phage lambda lysogenization HflD
MKLSIRLIGLAGGIFFLFAFAVTFTSPIHIEKAAKEFIRGEIESQVNQRIDTAQNTSLTKLSNLLANQYQDQISDIQQKLKEGLPEKIAITIAQMQDLSCECRNKLANRIQQSYELQLVSLNQAQNQLVSIMQGKYVEIVNKLLRDIKIFTGTNALIFMLLLLTSYFNQRAIAQLFLPCCLLLVATSISSYFYVFNQNWFFTIIYNDYVGFGYMAYLFVIFLFLCDMVFNKARVTTTILNQALSAISNISLSPC